MSKLKKNILVNNIHKYFAFLIIVILSVIGVHFLISSHAQTPYTSTLADSGTITSPANIQNCVGSNDGKCLKFGNTIGIKISNGQLVDGNGKTIRLFGVDATGTENACIQNKGLSWNISSTQAEDDVTVKALLSWHINAVRVQLNEDCWLAINGAPSAYSGQVYQTAINNFVNTLNKAGIYAILDLHWAAPGTYTANQQWAMANVDHSLTFWNQVASIYKTYPGVIYDPFNEPFISVAPNPGWTPAQSDWLCWLNGCSITENIDTQLNGNPTNVTYSTAGMQQLVDTIRATGSTQPIIIGGLNYAGDPCGTKNIDGNNGQCSQIINMPKDPLNQLAISFHTYNWTACTTTSCWDTTVKAANAARLPIITGEVGERDCTHNYMDSYMNWADSNNVSYVISFWLVNIATSCTVGDPVSNTALLQALDGTPSTVLPQAGVDYKSHLLLVNP